MPRAELARFLAPAETAEKLQQLGVPPDQILMTWPNKTCTVGDLEIRATFAVPFSGDDLTHVGYLVRVDGGPCVYFTGDTAYHELLGDFRRSAQARCARRGHQPGVSKHGTDRSGSAGQGTGCQDGDPVPLRHVP